MVKERLYCTADFKVTQKALGRPIEMTLKLDFNGMRADGWALSFQQTVAKGQCFCQIIIKQSYTIVYYYVLI
jgi:hypothetical protein